MAFLFRAAKRNVTPHELVAQCKASLQKGEAEQVTRQLQQMKTMYFGDVDHEPSPDRTMQLAQEIYASDLIPLLITNLHRLEFEAKKDVVALFNNLLRRQTADRLVTVDYLTTKPDTIVQLSKGYSTSIALQSGPMLRECIKHESLAKLLYPEIWEYFDYIEHSTFDVASDSFATFRALLTTHKPTEWILTNYDRFFELYLRLLTSTNYVWKRQSLKLLGELLLDRTHYSIMSRYIQSVDNLKLIMNLLRDRSSHIQFEAFHVFKVFVANPKKSPLVREILIKNRSKLISYLEDFHNDRKDDEQFIDEKQFIIHNIRDLA